MPESDRKREPMKNHNRRGFLAATIAALSAAIFPNWSTRRTAAATARQNEGARAMGRLSTTLASNDPTGIVEDVEATAGTPDIAGPLTVFNDFAWEADQGALCAVEWNQTRGRWQIYQLACPDDAPTFQAYDILIPEFEDTTVDGDISGLFRRHP